MKTMTLTT